MYQEENENIYQVTNVQNTDLLFFEIVPSHCFGASEASKIDCLKNQVQNFWTKNFDSLLKNGYFGALIFQEIDLFYVCTS